MTIEDTRRRPSPGDMPERRRRSGCFLRHFEDECDCVRPWAAEHEIAGCTDCWGNGDPCAGCGGWGEVRARSGGWVRGASIGHYPTGPSTTRDPWADAVVWTDTELNSEPPF